MNQLIRGHALTATLFPKNVIPPPSCSWTSIKYYELCFFKKMIQHCMILN